MNSPPVSPDASPDEASGALDAPDPVAEARELIERGDYRRARHALASAEASLSAHLSAHLSPQSLRERAEHLARLRASVGADPLVLGLSSAGAAALVVVAVLVL